VTPIKCVVWDLDDTLWRGTLLEDPEVHLRDGAAPVLDVLDQRGILHSIASANDSERALAKLAELGLAHYFLCPQIGWSSKAESIRRIAESLDIALDAVAFVDDQPFEREAVRFSLPEVRCIDAGELEGLPARPDLTPRFLTPESRTRRQMYQADSRRRQAEEDFTGPQEEFLATLEMRFTIARAAPPDLERAAELTVRTHQLNSTGRAYGTDELRALCGSPRHRVLVGRLQDRFGDSGLVAVALLECAERLWTIKLLLTSCRVLSRGIGSILLHHIMREAMEQGVALHGEFVANDRNRAMQVAYRFAGFREHERREEVSILSCDLAHVQPAPSYLSLQVVR
jgi:FkbH-like protein